MVVKVQLMFSLCSMLEVNFLSSSFQKAGVLWWFSSHAASLYRRVFGAVVLGYIRVVADCLERGLATMVCGRGSGFANALRSVDVWTVVRSCSLEFEHASWRLKLQTLKPKQVLSQTLMSYLISLGKVPLTEEKAVSCF